MVNVVLECSRLASNQEKSNNTHNLALWTNNVGSGIQLNTGDNVRVQSAYINEVGVGSDTIEFSKDDPLQETITCQYYKSGDGENLLQLPRNWLDDDTTSNFRNLPGDSLGNGNGSLFATRLIVDPTSNQTSAVVEFGYNREGDFTANPPEGADVYSKIYNQNYFNQRLTMMTSDLNNPYITPYDNSAHMESCFFDYQIFTKDINISIPQGHLTPSNICSIINKQLVINDGQIKSYDKLNNVSTDGSGYIEPIDFPYPLNDTGTYNGIVQKFNSYHPFQCATFGTYCKGVSELALASAINQDNINTGIENCENGNTVYHYSSFHSIAVFDPALMIAGRELMTTGKEIHTMKLTYGKLFPNGKYIILTDFPYNDVNTTKLKKYRDAILNNPLIQKESSYLQRLFFHIQSNTQQALGDDTFGSDVDFQKMSLVQYIEYDNANKDVYNESGDASFMNYGFIHAIDNDGVLCCGYTVPGNNINSAISYNIDKDDNPGFTGCNFGYDFHWSAYSTNAFLLYNSLIPYQYFGTKYTTTPTGGVATGINSAYSQYGLSISTETSSTNNFIYVGAENPLLNFDSNTSRFFWSDLHTARKIRNTPVSGSDQEFDTTEANHVKAPDSALGITSGAGTAIYTFNPTLDTIIYNPEYWREAGTPTLKAEYQKSFFSKYSEVVIDGVSTAIEISPLVISTEVPTICYNAFNRNTVYDSQGGLFMIFNYNNINDFNNSIWFKLGFTYEGLGLNLEINKQTRVSSGSLICNPLTTNASITSESVEDVSSNAYGASVSTPWGINPLSTTLIVDYNKTSVWYGAEDNINITCNSFQIQASNKPIKQKYPYYTIRSDILLNKNYIGGINGVNLPVVGIANKAYVSDDYYFMLGSDLNFVVDSPFTLTSITQSIHNPLGEFASVDKACSVIYMIEKIFSIPRPLIEPVEEHNIPPPQPRRPR
tara:strand:+ start:129 stop:2957 length:2829 start_codon:yes stop_codon:yes gene_type:complete